MRYRSHKDQHRRNNFGDEWYESYCAKYANVAAERGVQVIVTQSPRAPEIPTEVIAQEIVELSAAMKKIDAGKLNRKGLLVLLAHASGLPQKAVKDVLDALSGLEKLYLK